MFHGIFNKMFLAFNFVVALYVKEGRRKKFRKINVIKDRPPIN